MPGDKKSSMKRCKACGSLLAHSAKSCFNCGSPTNSVSALAHRHRSLITALGGLVGLIGLGFIIFNLMMTREALELERQKFTEEFQPQISIRYLSYDVIKSGADLNFGIMNTGKGIAYNLTEQIFVVTAYNDTIKADTNSYDRLINSSEAQSMRIIRIERDPISGFPIVITWKIRYWWQGEPTYVDYKTIFEITWDSAKKGFVVSKIAG